MSAAIGISSIMSRDIMNFSLRICTICLKSEGTTSPFHDIRVERLFTPQNGAKSSRVATRSD